MLTPYLKKEYQQKEFFFFERLFHFFFFFTFTFFLLLSLFSMAFFFLSFFYSLFFTLLIVCNSILYLGHWSENLKSNMARRNLLSIKRPVALSKRTSSFYSLGSPSSIDQPLVHSREKRTIERVFFLDSIFPIDVTLASSIQIWHRLFFLRFSR